MGSKGIIRTVAAMKMAPREFIQLAALGTAASAPVAVADVCSAVDDIVGHLWMPVAEVVAGCVEELVRQGSRQVPADRQCGEGLLTITASGGQHLGVLLARPPRSPKCGIGSI